MKRLGQLGRVLVGVGGGLSQVVEQLHRLRTAIDMRRQQLQIGAERHEVLLQPIVERPLNVTPV